jgi:hypothetical protein
MTSFGYFDSRLYKGRWMSDDIIVTKFSTMLFRVVRPQVLNEAFLSASNDFKQKLPELTHNQKVGDDMILYDVTMI